MTATFETEWTIEEWSSFEKKLRRLSKKDLQNLAEKFGIRFDVKDPSIIKKEEYINVLDEAPKDALMVEVEEILRSRK